MAELMALPTFRDERGALTVLEKKLPFEVKRVYWMHDLNGEDRGGHRHLKTTQALVCLHGSCEVLIQYKGEQNFSLKSPEQCLILNPEDWHLIQKIAPHSVLMVLASHEYDASDYRTDPL